MKTRGEGDYFSRVPRPGKKFRFFQRFSLAVPLPGWGSVLQLLRVLQNLGPTLWGRVGAGLATQTDLQARALGCPPGTDRFKAPFWRTRGVEEPLALDSATSDSKGLHYRLRRFATS